MRIANLLFLLLLCPMLAFGQGAISAKIQKAGAKKAQEAFTIAKDYNTNLQSENVTTANITEGILFTPDLSGIRDLQKAAPEYLELSLQLPGLGDKQLALIPNQVLADDFVLRDSEGGVVDYQPGLYYYGTLLDDPTSLVALSVFDNELHGVISTSEGNFVVGLLEGSDKLTHIIYNDNNMSFDLDCGTEDDGRGYSAEELAEPTNAEDVGDCIRVYVEVDNDIVVQKGGVTNAVNYVTGLFNESITLYANENLAMQISEMFAWSSTSPYSSSSSSGMLSDFQNATGSFNGDLAHLVSYQASGGIAAGFSGICNSNPDNSKCFSSISSSYSQVPVYSFSVMVVTHEMGHLIGSRHTHACVWNGNNTAIDGCAGQTEGSCSLPGSPSSGGTIMSYCHLTTGIDFTQGFGPQPGNVVRNTIANSNCTSPCGAVGPNCFDGIQNGNETGVDCGGDCDPCPVPCTDNEVVVAILTDNYPGETTWTITNSSGSVVASGGPYASSNTQYSETVCIVDGCFDFRINDSYGDGICCSYGVGNYNVSSGGTTLASGGQFGSSETTNFCLGGGPAPTCNDGIQNQGEEGIDCGGPCAPCYSCNDGIQNGQETGVDCGGPDCIPCQPSGTTEILGSYFETGWDGWQDGGSDCYRDNDSRSYEGNYSIRLRDNSGNASSMSTSGYNISGYDAVEVTFFFYPYSMENGEDFWFRIRQGSGSWQTVAAYAAGTNFNNNTYYTSTVTLTGSQLGSNTSFRFQCDASANGDQIYMDAITITGVTGALIDPDAPTMTITELETGVTPTVSLEDIGYQSSSVEALDNDVLLFPNPATDMLQVRSGEMMSVIRIVNATGQVVSTLKVDADQTAINVADLKPGVYYLMVNVNGEQRPQRFVKQ
ncbi:hypothetical protein CEQ90_08035 [Lewinellaceae bacterium SD302]|nr:hypothetical protein CEQ90_08035 [Lewinellaceae bacterium SD302]